MWWEVDLLTLQMTIKNPGDDCKLHMLIRSMVCVLPHMFRGGLSQAAENTPPAVGRSYKFREGRHLRPSAWVSHWSHLHRSTGGPWRVTGHSGHHGHICLLEGWKEDGDPRLRTNFFWKRISNRISGSCVGSGLPMLWDSLNFPGWHIRIICGLPLFQDFPLFGQLERGCTEKRSSWPPQSMLPATAVCVPTKHGPFPPGGDRDKEMAPYTSWPPWGRVSQLPSHSFVPSLEAADWVAPAVPRLQILLEPMAGMNKYLGDLKRQLLCKKKYFFINFGQALQTSS